MRNVCASVRRAANIPGEKSQSRLTERTGFDPRQKWRAHPSKPRVRATISLKLQKDSVNFQLDRPVLAELGAIVAADLSRPLLNSFAATLALAAIAAPAAAAKAPGPIAGKGYHLAFHDDFSHFRKRVWTRKIWYDDPPPRHAIHTKSGVLRLVSRRNQGYPDITVTTLKSRSFRHGYFEARMSWTKGIGAWPAFWLVSTRHAKNPAFPSLNPYCANHGLLEVRCWNSELDVFEGQGAEPHTFYGTLHRNTNDYYGASDSTNNPAWKSLGADMTKGFHRYAVLWTASEVRWYFDGHQVLRAPTSPPPTSRCSSSSTCGSAGPTPRTRRPRTVSERRSTG